MFKRFFAKAWSWIKARKWYFAVGFGAFFLGAWLF